MLQGISTRFCGRTESCTIWAGWGGPDAGLVGSFKGNVEMNERGQVIACSDTNSTINPVTGTPTIDPFLWDKEDGMIDLGTWEVLPAARSTSTIVSKWLAIQIWPKT